MVNQIKSRRIILVMLLLVLGMVEVLSTSAQDTNPPQEGTMGAGLYRILEALFGTPNPDSPLNPYVDVPQSRTEDGAFVLGSPDASITIVIFEDFLCPHCQAYQPTIHQMIDTYVRTGQAKFEYRMLPAVDPIFSFQAAKLAECAAQLRPGAFWQAHDLLFEMASTERFNEDSFQKFSTRMDLNSTALAACLESAEQVIVDATLAQQLGVQATPTVMIRYGNGPLQWPYDSRRSGGLAFEELATLIRGAN